MTAQELALLSFADLGVIRPGEVPSTTVLDDLLVRLNSFVASAGVEPLMTFLRKLATFNLAAGTSRYTFGVGGSFNVAARPVRATGWKGAYGTFSDGGQTVTIEEVQAASKAAHGETTPFPSIVGTDTTSPLINVAIFPAPNSAPGTLELTYFTEIPQFAALTTTLASIGFSDGWEEFLHLNFALVLLPRYGRQGFSPDALIKMAQLSKEKLATNNAPTQAPAQ